MKVFCASPWIPIEWIWAHGHDPCGIWTALEDLAGAAPQGMCPFAHGVAELATKHLEAAFVLTTACDQIRRAADAISMESNRPVFLFNLPATWQTPAAHLLYRAELTRLGEFLERLGGCRPSQLELMLAITRYSERRAQLFQMLGHGSARQLAEALVQYFGSGGCSTSPKNGTTAERGIPLALVGGPLLPSQWKILNLIESAGGRVVLNATEPGERCLVPSLPDTHQSADLLTALADHYFEHCVDVFQRPNTRLYDWLAVRIAERGVRAILLWVNLHCDLWRAEAQTLRERFGLPVVILEAQDMHTNVGRAANRLTALIETVCSRSQNFEPTQGALSQTEPHP